MRSEIETRVNLRDRRFFVGMAIVATVIVFLGFAPTYYFRSFVHVAEIPDRSAGLTFAGASHPRARAGIQRLDPAVPRPKRVDFGWTRRCAPAHRGRGRRSRNGPGCPGTVDGHAWCTGWLESRWTLSGFARVPDRRTGRHFCLRRFRRRWPLFPSSRGAPQATDAARHPWRTDVAGDYPDPLRRWPASSDVRAAERTRTCIGRARPHAPVARSLRQPLGCAPDSGHVSYSGGDWADRQLACVRGLAHSLK